MTLDLTGKVALVTGAAHGLGAGMAERLAALGAHVVVADIEDEPGRDVAGRIDGRYIHCDVRDLTECERAVEEAAAAYGGLDIAVLNAGIATGFTLGASFDPKAYHRAVAINLDGVVHGVVAALPALRARGGGDIVATASLAGLTGTPFDPVYSATKHAVVGLVRSLAVLHEREALRVNAICPGYADTRIVDPLREGLDRHGVLLMPVAHVVDALIAVLAGQGSGECWYVQPGRPAAPFSFSGIPGPRE